MKKKSKVVFINDELEKNFYDLNSNDFLKKSIVKAIKDLRDNSFCGIQIPKRLIPEIYIKNLRYFI
jgi:Txe/YoeB family toxin of Txe-Axe toxin-antitoxin module